MVSHSSENEGFRLLDEFACPAIPDPSVLPPEGFGTAVGRGENAGMQVWEEFALDSTGKPSQDGGSVSEEVQETIATLSPSGGPVIEIVMDRDFSCYTADEQERLLSAVRELLMAIEEVRLVKRVVSR